MGWNSRLAGAAVGILVLAGTGVFLPARQAWADPHAVFYTATAQAQLFFNVLAALNQADFVELSGQSAQSVERSGLLSRRSQASSTGAQEALEATQTNLSSLISRPVTLEGYDLYTDYLVRGLAAEKSRITSGEELARLACERVFGVKECQGAGSGLGLDGDPNRLRDQAFITDPLEWGARSLAYGVLPALFSGNETIEDIREFLSKKESYGEPRPFAFSEPLFVQRLLLKQQSGAPLEEPDQTGSSTSSTSARPDPALVQAWDTLLHNTSQEFVRTVPWGTAAGTYPFSDIREINGQMVSVLPAGATIDDALRQGLLNLSAPRVAKDEALAASDRITYQQRLTQVEGSKGAAEVKVHTLFPTLTPEEQVRLSAEERARYQDLQDLLGNLAATNNNRGELSLTLQLPAAERRAALEDAYGYPHQADVNQKVGALQEFQNQGPDDLGNPPPGGDVEGIRSDGRVAGINDPVTVPVAFDINPAPAHAQGGYAELLQVILPPRLWEAASIDASPGAGGFSSRVR